MNNPSRQLLILVAGFCFSLAQAAPLRVEVRLSRGVEPVSALVKTAVHSVHVKLESFARAERRFDTPFFFPQRVELTSAGNVLPFSGRATRSPGLTLAFNTSGAGSFTSEYVAE